PDVGERLQLKYQEMVSIYGAIEILFVRTPPDALREQIVPQLGGGSKPSRDLLLLVRRQTSPPSIDRVEESTKRRWRLRVYAAFSAAFCATQSQETLYTSMLMKEARWEDLVQLWEPSPPDLTSLSPVTDFQEFPRPGYSFSFLAAPPPGARGRPRRPGGSGAAAPGEEATLLGGGLWAATPA
ncbi:unnamed protein product, partial [Polarella glacialis]